MPTIISIPSQTLNAGIGNPSTLTMVASGITNPSTVSVQLSGADASMFTVGATTATPTGTPGTYNLSTALTGTVPHGSPVPVSPQLFATVTADGSTSPQVPVPCTIINPQDS